MEWNDRIHGDPLTWLLEPDPDNPGVRLFALTDLLDLPSGDERVCAARRSVMASGPVPVMLDAMAPEGYWGEPGAVYGDKYHGTLHQIVLLAMLGADGNDPRVQRACEYVLAHYPSEYGGFSIDGRPSLMIQCMQGNQCAALIELGWWGDERLVRAVEWLARSITGAGIAPAEEKNAPVRYFRSGNSGPGFGCGANGMLTCGWAAVKAALALGKLPAGARSQMVSNAARAAGDFLLAGDPLNANYPTLEGKKPSRSWFQFGIPLGYIADVLQNLEALAALGRGQDPRAQQAAEWVLNKQDERGRWVMEYSYNGKLWSDIEQKGQPSKWVTLRALRAVRRIFALQPVNSV